MAKDQELLQAVKSNDLAAFRKLATKLKASKTKKGGKKYNVNIQDEDGFTACHHASLMGSSEIILGLIDLDCDINARDHKGMSPLHLAAWSGNVEVARLLVETGAHINAGSDNGDTPLILACQHGNSDVVDVLLDRGCNSWSTNKGGESALDLACRFGHVHVVELLLKSKEVRSVLASGEPTKNDPPLHLASKTGHVEIVRMLLEADADLNHVTSNGTCLHEAALYGKTEVVKTLLEWGIDSNARNDEGYSALDVVNLFTSSKASSEIKQLLKDAAAADRTVYARAVRDHFNMLDPTALPFKTGDTIIVLEQNENDRWKGKIKSGDKEKVGYFPGNCVRLPSSRRGKRSSRAESSAVAKGSYEMVALAPVPSSPGMNRNSPRLSSFGKKGARNRGDESTESADQSPSPAPVPLPEKGLKAKKGSVKLGTGLQYVEVAVEKVPLSPPQSSAGGSKANSKTQYAEVLLPPNNYVEKVNECEDVPQLPQKSNKKPLSVDEPEDIWVRKPPSHPPPSLPPKKRTKSDAADSDLSAAKAVRPPAVLPAVTEPASHANPEGRSVPSVSNQAKKRVATPELSRKGYEEMTVGPVSGGRETPPVEDVWKPQPVNIREHSRQQPLPYENVSLPQSRKVPLSDKQSMRISDIDQPAEGEDGYVVVNQQPSKPADSRSYENVTPSAVTQGAVTPRTSSSATKRAAYENVKNDGYYVPMTGGVPSISKQIDRTDNKTVGVELPEDRNSADEGESTDAMDYELMKSDALPVKHQYVNIKKPGNAGAGDRSEPTGQIPLKMRDYNALYDWLERFKLTIYIDNFVKGGFDMTSMHGLTAEDLTAINVKKTGHRKKILSEVAKLEETTVFPNEKPKDIMSWLRLIGLEQYIPEFMDGGFDDMDFLQDMTVEDLVTIGVTKPGHQRKIWMAVNALKGGDENGNLLTIQTETELTPQERKGYLETCLDGDDSGVSTDEVEPDNARTDDSEMDFPPPPTFPLNEEPLVEDSSSAESESAPERGLRKDDTQSLLPCENIQEDQQEDRPSELPQISNNAESIPSTEVQEKVLDKNDVDPSLGANTLNVNPTPDSEDDEPPPRPPPPMEDIDISLPVPDTKLNNLADDSKVPVSSVKDAVRRENDRIRAFTVDSTFQKPRKPGPPPPVKPKSAKKPPPPAVKPKPRKSASLSGSSDKSSGDESSGDRSPMKPHSPLSPKTSLDRRSSTGSNPNLWPSSPSNRLSGDGSLHSRSSSTSSQGSVESIIEEMEEKRRSFEKPGRKSSAPERLNTSYEYSGGKRLSAADATRAEGELDKQIKQILRPRSREDLATVTTESSEAISSIPQNEAKTTSTRKDGVKTEEDSAEELMKDINSMLSDFSSELDSMFD